MELHAVRSPIFSDAWKKISTLNWDGNFQFTLETKISIQAIIDTILIPAKYYSSFLNASFKDKIVHNNSWKKYSKQVAGFRGGKSWGKIICSEEPHGTPYISRCRVMFLSSRSLLLPYRNEHLVSWEGARERARKGVSLGEERGSCLEGSVLPRSGRTLAGVTPPSRPASGVLSGHDRLINRKSDCRGPPPRPASRSIHFEEGN